MTNAELGSIVKELQETVTELDNKISTKTDVLDERITALQSAEPIQPAEGDSSNLTEIISAQQEVIQLLAETCKTITPNYEEIRAALDKVISLQANG